MRTRVLSLSIFLCAFLAQIVYSQTATVRFYVNMNGQIDKGNFTIGVDTLDVAADFNGWEVSADTLAHIGDGIYMVSYVDSFYVGQTLEYKFRINSDWATSELWGQQNRKYVVQTINDSVYHFYNDYIVNATLLAFFPFDGNANDESGRDHNGTIMGATLDANRFNKPDSSYYFNGMDYIDYGPGLSLINNANYFTISAWIYPNDLHPAQNTILAERNNGNNYQLAVKDDALFFSYWSGGMENDYMGTRGVFQDNKWYHVVVTSNGGYLRMFINGQEDAYFMAYGPIDNNPSPLQIGTIYTMVSSPFQGRIDEIRFYDRPLSDGEVRTLFALRELNNDLSVAAIAPINSGNQCGLTANETVIYMIVNNGLSSADEYDLSYSTDGGASFLTVPVNMHLEGGDTLMHFVYDIDFSGLGAYGLWAATVLPGDELPDNDTLIGPVVVNKLIIEDFPYTQDFEGGPDYWTVEGKDPSWELGTPAGDVITGAASGSNAWMTGLSTPHNLDEQSWVESPCFDFSGLAHPMVEFKIWYYLDFVGAGTFQFSIDNGSSWWTIGGLDDYLNWYNNMNSSLYFTGSDMGWMGYGKGWTTVRHTLDGLGGQPSVMFRIAFGSQQGTSFDGFAFDDVRIFEQPAQEAGVTAITYPSTDCQLYVQDSPNVEITNFGSDTIFDIEIFVQLDGDTPQSMTMTGYQLLPGYTETYYLGDILLDFSWDSIYTIKAWIAVPGDSYPENDTLWKEVANKITIDVFPYFENFENPGHFWTVSPEPDPDNHRNASWELGEPAGTVINDPGNTAWVTNLTGEFNFDEYSYIESPCFDFYFLSSPILEFKIWRDLPDDYSGQVYVMCYNGSAWNTLGSLGDYLNWYNEGYQEHLDYAGDDLGWAAVTDGEWITVRHPLDGLGGQSNIKIRIYFASTQNWSNAEGVAIDDIIIFQRPNYDMRMVQWISPQSGPKLTSHEQVEVNIKNDGQLEAQVQSYVKYSIDGGLTWRTTTIEGEGFITGEERLCVFDLPEDTADFSAYGEYSCIAVVTHPWDTIINDNDSITLTITNAHLIETFPYIQDFEEGDGYWTQGGQNSSWALGTPAAPNINHAASGAKAWVTNLTGNHNPNERAWVESPYFNLTGMMYPYIKLDKWSSIHWNEGATFQYSADSGKTWSQVGEIGMGTNWYNHNIDALNFLPDNSGWSDFDPDWVTAEYDLSSIPQTGPVKFRFIFGTNNTDDTEGFGFDNIRIYDRAMNGAVIYLIQPATNHCNLNSAEQVAVQVKNWGVLSWDSLRVSYQINLGPVISETIYETIPADFGQGFFFTQTADLSVHGTYNFKIWTEIFNDGWPFDDTLFIDVNNKPTITSFPYFQDFEGTSYWTSGGQNSSWQLGSPNGSVIDHTASGLNAWNTNLIGPYNQDEQSFVESPCFSFLSFINHPVIRLKIWNHTNWQAGAALQYSTDGGINWNNIGNQGERINWYDNYVGAASEMGGGDCWTGISYYWMTASYDLGWLAGEPDIRFRIIFASEPGADNSYDGFAFDDIMIYDRPAQDAFMVHINNPSTGCNVNPHIDFEVLNAGTAMLDSLTIGYQVNGETPGSVTFHDPINPDNSYWNGFDIQDYFTAPGEYIVKLWTSVPGDMTGYNDTLYRKVVTQPLINENPYIQDFESGTHYWTAVFDGYASHEKLYPGGLDYPEGWKSDTPDGAVINSAASGTNAWITHTGGPPYHDISFVVSPCLDLRSYFRPSIEFKMWRQLVSLDMGVALQYSTDQGSTWLFLGDTGDTLNWYNDPGDHLWVMDHYGDSIGWNNTTDPGWVTARHLLDGLGGEPNVKLRFVSHIKNNFDRLDGFAFDDVMIYDLKTSQDAAIGNVVAPENKCEFLPDDTVKVEIRNAGTASITNVGVHYQLNGDDPVNELFTGTLAPDETTIFSFSATIDLSAYQQYELTAWVSLTGDSWQDNDTIHSSYISAPLISTFPYYQDFEGGNDYWHSYGYANSWALGTPAGSVINSAASGTNAWVTNLTGPYNNNEYSHVESPCFDFTGLINPVFDMDIWTDCEDLDDGAALQYSLDNGNTWQTLGSQGTSWYNYTSPPEAGGMAAHGILSYWTDRSWGWWHVHRGMSGLAGVPGVRFRITFANDSEHNTEGFAFDNVQIYDKSAVAHFDISGTAIVIDGIPEEQLWLDAAQYPIENVTGTVDSPDDLSGYWSATWDPANFYILVNVTDEHLFNFGPGGDHYQSDGVEILFDLLNNKDGEGAGNYDNRSFNFVWNLAEFSGNHPTGEGIEFPSLTSGTGYVFEIKIPWTSLLKSNEGDSLYLHISPATGTQIGIDVRLKDNDNDANVEASMNWAWADVNNLNGAATMLLDNRPPLQYDLEVAEITDPGDLLCQPTIENVTIQFINRGTSPFTDPEVSYTLDEVTWINEAWSGTANPGDTITYTFATQANLYSDLYYKDLRITAKISDPRDENLFNNSKYKNIPLYGNHIQPDGWSSFSVCDIGVYPNAYMVYGLSEDQSGRIWAGFYPGGIASYNGSDWTVYNIGNSGIPSDSVLTVVTAGTDTVWIGHFYKGVTIFNGSAWTNFNTGNSPLPSDLVRRILKASDGTYWLGTSLGLVQFDNGAWTIYNTGNSGIPANSINAICEDQSGNIWIGTSNGAAMFDGAGFTVFNSGNSNLSYNNVFDLLVDSGNNVWAGTFEGLYRYDWSDWEVFNTGNSGLPGNGVVDLFQASNGEYWFGTQDNGVARYNGSEWWVYTTSEGLTNNTFWRGNILQDASGRIWFPTINGIAVKESYPVEIYRINKTDIYCEGSNNGSIQILAISNDPLQYSIDGGINWQAGNMFTDLIPGDYDIAVTNEPDTIWPGMVTINEFANISSYPYFEDFESGDGNWKAGGDAPSWAYGNPQGPVIGHPFSGSNAWVTNLNGEYNDLEMSWIESQCFDFSSMVLPVFEMQLWIDCEDLDDGAALQYSTDGGNFWFTVGSAADDNWYNWISDPAQRGPAREGILEYFTNRSWDWFHVSHQIPELAGEPSVRFRIIFGNDTTHNTDGIGVDDISIFDGAVAIPWDVSGINVDGIAYEPLWTSNPVIPLHAQGLGGSMDLSASWRAAWDADNLYLLVDVTDDTLFNAIGAGVPDSWKNDNVEIYLNLYNNMDGMGYQTADNWGLRYIWNLPVEDGEQVPGIEFTNSTSPTGYVFEIKLPWSGLLQNGMIDIPLATGTMIGFDLKITDNDGSGPEVRINWKNAIRTNFNEAGNILLSGRPPINMDAKVAAIDAPDINMPSCQPPPQDVTVRIVNNGLQPISDFNAGFSVDGMEQAVETITDTINPGDTLLYTFATQADLSTPGFYKIINLRAYTLLPGDEVPQNDSKGINLQVYGENIPTPGWTMYGPCDYNNTEQITGVAEDNEGNIWIGTGGGGVMMYDGLNFTTYDTANSAIGGVNVEVIYADDAGNVLVGDWYNGLSIFNGTTWTNYNTSNSDISGDVVEGLLYYDGLYYIGTDGGGLDVFDGSSFITHYNTGNSGIIDDGIQGLAVDSTGNIWIAASYGISIFDGTNFTNYTRDTLGTPTAYIYRVMADGENNIWVGTYNGGIIKINGGTWTNYTTANSLLSNNRIFSLGQDKHGRIWIGTFGNGYDVFNPAGDPMDPNSWRHYNMENVLPSNNSWQNVLTASDGRLWLPTYNGLVRYNIEYFDPIPIPYEVTGITLDGIGNEPLWAGAPVVNMDATGPEGPADLSARWRAAWDADNLYVLVEVTDDTLFNAIDPASAIGYTNDNVEIYLDMLNNKDGMNYTTPDNWRLRYIWDLPLEHGEKVAGVEFTNTSSDSGYVFEFKFPWLSLLQSGNIDVPLVTGTQIGFDVKITDNDGSGVFYRYTWKSAVAGNFDGAGAIMLEGRPPITNDAKTIAIIQPVDTMYYCQPLPQDVTIRIANAGEQPISDFDVAFMVDTIEQAVETIADTLWPGDSLTYTFATQADLYYSGFFRNTMLKAYVMLPGDEMMQNDIKVINLRVYGDNLGTPGWTLIGPCEYNSGDMVSEIVEDDAGNYWIGTGYGVVKFDGTTFTTYDIFNSGLAGMEIETMTKDDAGNILFGTWYNGLSIYDGSTWSNYDTVNSELSNNMVEALLYHDGLYYIGTDGGGLDVFDGSDFVDHYNTGNSGIVGDQVYDLDIDSSGNFWIAAVTGISIFDGTIFTNYSAGAIGSTTNNIYRVFIDDSNTVWVGTHGSGLFRLDDTVWTSFNTANSGLSHNSVFSISQDNAGNMWFYTFGGGLDKFDGTTWINYNMNNVLPSNHSWQPPLMASDGRIWFPTYNGIAINDPSIQEQVINLAEGWNIFSTYLVPFDADMQAIVQPLIDGGLLVKIQDEAGASVDSVPGIGWVNNIGNLGYSEGYKIKVKTSTPLAITGTLLPLPAAVDLADGWNIISYPEVAPEDAATVLDSLIISGYLEKVQDETGSAYENVPPIGWIDNIGQFLPGEGYKLKVNTSTSLMVYESTLKSGVIIRPVTLAPIYFRLAYSGNGLDHMNLYIVDPAIDGLMLEPGDEIAVYDGQTCVGAGRIGYEYTGYISLIASRDDPTTKDKDGFTPGNQITFRIWDAGEHRLIEEVEASYYPGYSDRFLGTATTLLGLNAISEATGTDELSGLVTQLGDNYPNPFGNETTIEYSVGADMKVTISVYDLLGRKIRILVDQEMPAGAHKVLWNGKDDLDLEVTPGMYFYEMKAGDYRAVKRMNLIY